MLTIDNGLGLPVISKAFDKKLTDAARAGAGDAPYATPRQINRAVNTPVTPKADGGIPAELRRVPATVAVTTDIPSPPQLTGNCHGGMIFLRRSGESKHWVYMFTGIKHVQCGAELDVPVPCGATLRDVLAWLGTAYAGKLGGAWLLVAP